MLKRFKEHIDLNLTFLKDARLIIAISGGIDSVVLAYLCKATHLNFSLAHCNFNLRGEESDQDEEFVLELAEKLDVEVFIQRFDTNVYAKENKRSIQMAARELRYNWFNELASQLHYDFILTAHHADDNLETFLINFTRGTGLNGLTGIPTLNDNVVRPLLVFSRQDIEHFAKENKLQWREDSSNKKRKYLRNKLRHEVIPILKEINPQLLDSFHNTLEYLNDTADIVEESLNAVAKRAIVDIDDNGITYKISEFKKVNNSKAYLFEMFKDFGFTEWNDIVNLLDAQSGKFVQSSTHRLIKHREVLILSEVSTNRTSSVKIDDIDEEVETPLGKISMKIVNTTSKPTKKSIHVDKDKLVFPLEFRIWEDGDVFYPSGMLGKKKVSKYLKDEKLSKVDKEHTWILTSKNDVVWIIGRRTDRRFEVTDETNTTLKIELN